MSWRCGTAVLTRLRCLSHIHRPCLFNSSQYKLIHSNSPNKFSDTIIQCSTHRYFCSSTTKGEVRIPFGELQLFICGRNGYVFRRGWTVFLIYFIPCTLRHGRKRCQKAHTDIIDAVSTNIAHHGRGNGT